MAVATKSAALPDVPTVRELGFPNLELQGWNGFLAPKGTPEPVVARLHQEIAAAGKHPDVHKRMTDVGAEPSGSTPGRNARRCCSDQIAKVRPVVEELKLDGGIGRVPVSCLKAAWTIWSRRPTRTRAVLSFVGRRLRSECTGALATARGRTSISRSRRSMCSPAACG